MKAHNSKEQSDAKRKELDFQQKTRIKKLITTAITKGYKATVIHETISKSNKQWLKDMGYQITLSGGRLGEKSYTIKWFNAKEPSTGDL